MKKDDIKFNLKVLMNAAVEKSVDTVFDQIWSESKSRKSTAIVTHVGSNNTMVSLKMGHDLVEKREIVLPTRMFQAGGPPEAGDEFDIFFVKRS